MSNKEKILEMLKDNKLTVKEIAIRMNLKENAINVYICRLRDGNLIKKVNNINRYNVYTAIQKENNIESYPLDTQILKKLIKPFVERGIEADLENNEIIRIKELWSDIKNA